MILKDLDERFVPAMAEWLDRQLKRFPTPPDPNGPAPFIVRLRRVDDRWTSAGPLATLRDIPQLGYVLIGLLLFTGLVIAKARTPHRAPAPVAQPTTPPPTQNLEPDHLGPDIGDGVSKYIADAKEKLFRIASGQPDGTAVAVVSLSRYMTAAQVRDLMGPLQVRRVFFRAPLPLGVSQIHQVSVEDLVKDSRKAFLRVAAQQASEAKGMLSFAATITNDPAQKTQQEKDAKLLQREAAILRGPCKCVYAVVVRTRLRLLTDLIRLKDVRAIDTSRAGGVLQDYVFSALLPDEKKTVTFGNQAGGTGGG